MYRIVIVGGGSAGWMTASALAKVLPNHLYTITLVESKQIGTVSVGEATIPAIRQFNALLGLDENTFLKATKGTFKLGIEFKDWGTLGSQYMHPFGPYGLPLQGVPFYHYLLKHWQRNGKSSPKDFCLEWTAAKAGKFSRPVANAKNPLVGIKYAFHFDAVAYAATLKQLAISLGVTAIEGEIIHIEQHKPSGDIKHVQLKDERCIEGDLFIDCSGFKGLLIEKVLGVGIEDWRHYLPCDSAIAIPTERLPHTAPYTVSTAREAGWQWQIPLQHRIGNGHVFASDYMSESDAIDLLQQRLPSAQIGEPNRLRWINGYRSSPWQNNCVAIGLSAGFLEPLESTGLQLIQSAIMRLISLFPSRQISDIDRQTYNRYCREEMEQIRDFIILHYKASSRDDTPFWQYCQSMPIPDTMQEKLDLYKSHGRLFREQTELFNEISWFSVLNGQGIVPSHYHPLVDAISEQEVGRYFSGVKHAIQAALAQMPSHDDFIRAKCETH
nr:tryptophan halogenase family protein [Alteromonas sp. ASW11-130]